MLEIIVPKTEELWDPVHEIFLSTKETKLTLEHSLVSLKKWESKWKVPFLNNKQMTEDQLRDYVKCMTITQNVDPLVYYALTQENLKAIVEYMEDPMTATVINERNLPKGKGGTGQKVITAEMIYYWMTALNIPFECQKWHLNQLMTLIKVASIEQQPPKQMSKRDIMAQNKSLNAARRARMHSKG
ncbi:MAG: hypothetical protein IKU36_01725 [Bacteroidales bacterium]|nr:hypothetical protein [Clostridiales bacterium]MBR5298949.1 hypothetical protein [Bacteroidales bacterium]